MLFPNPATRPIPSGRSTFVEISQDRNSLRGKLKTQGDGVLHINISFPPRPFPRTSTGLSGGTLPPETERERERAIGRHKKQRAEIKNTALHVHRFLFVSTFYVRTWVFPRMGPRDNGGTHTILGSERLFPRRSTGLSGGTLPPRERESDRQLSMSRCGCCPGWVPRTMGEHITNN